MNPAERVAAALAEAGYSFDVLVDPVAGRVAQWSRRPPKTLMEKAHVVAGWPATFDDDFDATTADLQLALDNPTAEAWADFVRRDGGRPVALHLEQTDERSA